MERARPIPDGGIRPDDLVALSDRPGPFATVWMRRPGTGSYDADADELTRRHALGQLAEAGAPATVVDAVDDALAGLTPGARGAVVVADADGVRLVEQLPEPPRRERATWTALPALAPVIEHRQAQVPAIVVLADRTGADIVVARPGRDDLAVEVAGDEHPITKSQPGGWSQRRYQQRAEDSWEHNAGDVAERVGALAAEATPSLIVLGGDERAVTLVRERLPHDLLDVTRTIDPGRAADGSEDARDEAIARLVRTAVAIDTVELLRRFDEEDGRGERAAHGRAATLDALRRAQVDVLLVHDGEDDDDLTAWYGSIAGDVAIRREDLASADDGSSGRLVDVAIHAALQTGASVRVVPDAPGIRDGVAAILRWSE